MIIQQVNDLDDIWLESLIVKLTPLTLINQKRTCSSKQFGAMKEI
jgi:hypothetical protein